MGRHKKPLLGARQDDTRISWQCHYSPAPGIPLCLAEAKWHGIVVNGSDGFDHAGLPCCDHHLPQMRLTADYVHELVHPCCLPDAKFDEDTNRCRLDWDETPLFVGATEAVIA